MTSQAPVAVVLWPSVRVQWQVVLWPPVRVQWQVVLWPSVRVQWQVVLWPSVRVPGSFSSIELPGCEYGFRAGFGCILNRIPFKNPPKTGPGSHIHTPEALLTNLLFFIISIRDHVFFVFELLQRQDV